MKTLLRLTLLAALLGLALTASAQAPPPDSSALALTPAERIIKAYDDARQTRLSLPALDAWIASAQASNQNLLQRLARLATERAALTPTPPPTPTDVLTDVPPSGEPKDIPLRPVPPSALASIEPPDAIPPAQIQPTVEPVDPHEESPSAAPQPAIEPVEPDEEVLGAVAAIIDQLRERLERMEARLARLEATRPATQ